MTPTHKPIYLSDSEVAERLRLSRQAIQKWRQKHVGPPYIKLGKTVRYDAEELEAWIQSRTVKGAA
jgi:excisionase family DNA binding protein